MIGHNSGRTYDGQPESEADIPVALEERLRQHHLDMPALERETMTSAGTAFLQRRIVY